MSEKLVPYENTLSVEELRREVRECWDREHAVADALRDLPEMVPPWVLLFFSRAAKWPEDNNLGRLLQRKLGLNAVPPKSECEDGAWENRMAVCWPIITQTGAFWTGAGGLTPTHWMALPEPPK